MDLVIGSNELNDSETLQKLFLHGGDGQLQSCLNMRQSSPSTLCGTRAIEQSMERIGRRQDTRSLRQWFSDPTIGSHFHAPD
jgi:hypothetical protein